MIINDRQYGRPFVQYTGTKSAIEAFSGLAEGSTAYAIDTDQFGSYNGSVWSWSAALPTGTTSHVLTYTGTAWASAAPSEPLLLEDGTIAILENGHAAMSEPVFD